MLDVVFMIDASGSVGEGNFYKIVDFVSDMIDKLPFGKTPEKQTRVGMLTYGHKAKVQFRLKDYSEKEMMKDALYCRYERGSTNMVAALQTLREDMFSETNGDRPLVPNVAILFTDGKANDALGEFVRY